MSVQRKSRPPVVVRSTRHAWVLGRPNEGHPTWIAQCLDLNLSAIGDTLLDALDAIEVAVAKAVKEDAKRGREPFERRPAAASDWDQLWAVVRGGVLVTEEDLAMLEEPVEVIATQLVITSRTSDVRRAPAALVPSEVRL